MNTQPLFHAQPIITLPHRGMCGILGIAPNGQIYAEEIYPPDELVAQHILTSDGDIIASADEAEHPSLLTLPKDRIVPQIHPQTKILNYQGGRLRGLREAERLSDWAQPLPIADKMTLIQTLGLKINAMQLFGIIESVVLSSVYLHDDWFVVCRRMVLAIALPKVKTDSDGLPYDYDSHILQTAHLYHASWAEFTPIHQVVMGVGGQFLRHVYDGVRDDNQLYIASGGGDNKNNTIHRWSIEYPDQKG